MDGFAGPSSGHDDVQHCNYPFTRSPSMLAATASFDSVSPEPAISCTAMRMRSTSALRGLIQASTAAWPAAPLVIMSAGKAALRILDRIERAVERKAIEVIRDADFARRRHHAIEPEIRAAGKVCRRNIDDRLAGAVGNQNDIRRERQHGQIGDAARQRLGHAGFAKLLQPAPRGFSAIPPATRARAPPQLR